MSAGTIQRPRLFTLEFTALGARNAHSALACWRTAVIRGAADAVWRRELLIAVEP